MAFYSEFKKYYELAKRHHENFSVKTLTAL